MTCDKCKKELDYKPIRLYKYLYGVKKYKQYSPVKRVDLCKRCFGVIERWLNKWYITL